MNRRPPIVITLEILNVLHTFGKMNVSQLCLHTGLPYSRLRVQMDSLRRAGLVEELADGGREYVLTQDGRDTLFRLRGYVKSLSDVGLIERVDHNSY